MQPSELHYRYAGNPESVVILYSLSYRKETLHSCSRIPEWYVIRHPDITCRNFLAIIPTTTEINSFLFAKLRQQVSIQHLALFNKTNVNAFLAIWKSPQNERNWHNIRSKTLHDCCAPWFQANRKISIRLTCNIMFLSHGLRQAARDTLACIQHFTRSTPGGSIT
jgi:hypothetical protein